jgi:hypothetical protein
MNIIEQVAIYRPDNDRLLMAFFHRFKGEDPISYRTVVGTWGASGGLPLSWQAMEVTGNIEHYTFTDDEDVMRLYLVDRWNNRAALVRVSDGRALGTGEVKDGHIPPPPLIQSERGKWQVGNWEAYSAAVRRIQMGGQTNGTWATLIPLPAEVAPKVEALREQLHWLNIDNTKK